MVIHLALVSAVWLASISAALALDANQIPQWVDLQAKHRSEAKSTEWVKLVGTVSGGAGNKLEIVNQTVNRIPYVADPSDRWLSPTTFLRNGGDCEDYAFAKYFALKALGIKSRMAMMDGHAVLVAGKYVLDNRVKRVYPLTKDLVARIVYSFDEREWSTGLK